MKARGKSRLVGTSSLDQFKKNRTSPERAQYFGLSGLGAAILVCLPGATSRQVGTCPWLSYAAPLALFFNLSDIVGALFDFSGTVMLI